MGSLKTPSFVLEYSAIIQFLDIVILEKNNATKMLPLFFDRKLILAFKGLLTHSLIYQNTKK